MEDARKKGVKLYETTIPIDEFLSKITNDSVIILILDWSIILGKEDKGYIGHFVPVVGYDDENVYIHNQGFLEPTPFLPIKTEIFDRARKADGTDEDFLIIHRK